jgi:type IV pilus assembly protein PilY1
MNKKSMTIALSLLAVWGWMHPAPPARAADPMMADYAAAPIFIEGTFPPNILLNLDNSGSMNEMAYGHQGDNAYHTDDFGRILDGVGDGGSAMELIDSRASYVGGIAAGDLLHNLTDRSVGTISGASWNSGTGVLSIQVQSGMSNGGINNAGDKYWVESETMKSPAGASAGYYGDFVPNARYTYVGSTSSQDSVGYFQRDDANGQWSGNFLNWLTMRRGDIAKKVLVGGKAEAGERDGDGDTILVGETVYNETKNEGDAYRRRFPKLVGTPEGHAGYDDRHFYVVRDGYIEVYQLEDAAPDFNYSYNLTLRSLWSGFSGDNFSLADYDFVAVNADAEAYEITAKQPVLSGLADNMKDENLNTDTGTDFCVGQEMEHGSSYYYLYDPSVDFRGVVAPGQSVKIYDSGETYRGEAQVLQVPVDAQDILDTFGGLFPADPDCGLNLLHDMLNDWGGADGYVNCELNSCTPDNLSYICASTRNWEDCLWRKYNLGRDVDRLLHDIEPLVGHIVVFKPGEIHFPGYSPQAGFRYEFWSPQSYVAQRVAYFRIAVERNAANPDEAADFLNGNIAGIMQKFGDRVRFGFMVFNQPVGGATEGGKVLSPINSDMAEMVAAVQGLAFNTNTPLAETLYEAARYFQQVSPEYYTGDYAIGKDGNGDQWDPFKVEGYDAWCLESFFIQISDGEPFMDGNVPMADKDGDGYLDDVAFWAHNTDLRSGLREMQNLSYYGIFAFGEGSDLLKKAARAGAFEDVNGDGLPEPPVSEGGDPDIVRQEWDSDRDGIPDTYYEAANGHELQDHLFHAIESMMKKSGTGTAVTVLSTREKGTGTLYQAYFAPRWSDLNNTNVINWAGFMQAVWVDPWGNLRLDSVQDGRLVLTQDKIARYVFDKDETLIEACSDSDGDGKIDVENGQPVGCGKYKLVPDIANPDNAAPAVFEVGAKLAMTDPADRKIYTFVDADWDGVRDTSPVDELVAFDAPNVDKFERYLDVVPEAYGSYGYLNSSNGAARAENVVNFIRGEQIPGYRNRQLSLKGGQRVWKFGDVVYATPAVVGEPMEAFHFIYGDDSYKAFRAYHKEHRNTMIYVGANDGMLHAIRGGRFVEENYAAEDNTTKEAGRLEGYADAGTEAWAYIPFNLLPHLKWLAHPDYAHVYYVDNKAKVADVQIFQGYNDGLHINGWGTLLIGSMRMGGGAYPSGMLDGAGSERIYRSGYFLIDVTDAEASEPQVLAEFTHPDLGFSSSYPAIARVKEGGEDHWFMIVGSGFTNYEGWSTQKAKIFVLDLTKFMQDRVIEEGNTLYVLDDVQFSDNAFMGNPISVDVDPTPRDPNKDFVDVIYVGETAGDANGWRGTMYKIRPQGSINPAEWKIEVLVQTPANQAITAQAAPAVGFNKELWVYFGTGRFLNEDDETDLSVQSFYGIHDRCFDSGSECSSGTQVSLGDLVDVTAASVSAGTGELTGVEGASTFKELENQFKTPDLQYSGWRKNLLDDALQPKGERVLSRPSVLGGAVLFSTFSPPTKDICTKAGIGNLYALYFLTGTAHPRAILGESEGEAVESEELGIGMPAGVGLHVGEGSGGTAFMQQSTGAIEQLHIEPPLKFRSGVTAWRQW